MSTSANSGGNTPGIGSRVGIASGGSGSSGTQITPSWSPITVIVNTPSKK